GQPVDVRHGPGGLVVGTRGEPAPGAGEHDDAHVVVIGDLFDHTLERHHDVERHRVHALGAVQRDQRDVRARSVDEDQAVVHALHAIACNPYACSPLFCATRAASTSSASISSTRSSSAAGGSAPAWLNTSVPFLKAISVGMARICARAANSCSASVSTFACTTLGCFSDDTSNVGANCLHGPHHDAQKSTSTISLSLMVWLNVSVVISCVVTTPSTWSGPPLFRNVHEGDAQVGQVCP